MAKIISYTIFILLFVTGCSTDETEYFPEDNVLVEVKAPQTDGWSTKDYINTRNYPEKTTVRKEEDGLNKNTYASRYERNCKKRHKYPLGEYGR